MSSPVRWYCTWCGDQHQPDTGTQIDARYATGLCSGVRRPLVRDAGEADRLSKAGGKQRPKGVPIGGGEAPKAPVPATPEQTRHAQGMR